MKTILLFVMVLASTFGAAAQGLILFSSGFTSSTKVSTNSVLGGAATGLTAANSGLYYFALFYSTTANTVGANNGVIVGVGTSVQPNLVYAFNDPNWTFVALGTNEAAGEFGSTEQNADGSTTVNGVAGGSTARFVVVGWCSMGTSLNALEGYYNNADYDSPDWIGQSAVAAPSHSLRRRRFEPHPQSVHRPANSGVHLG